MKTQAVTLKCLERVDGAPEPPDFSSDTPSTQNQEIPVYFKTQDDYWEEGIKAKGKKKKEDTFSPRFPSSEKGNPLYSASHCSDSFITYVLLNVKSSCSPGTAVTLSSAL